MMKFGDINRALKFLFHFVIVADLYVVEKQKLSC